MFGINRYMEAFLRPYRACRRGGETYWSLRLKIYRKAGAPRLLRTVRQQSVKFGQAGACWYARIAFVSKASRFTLLVSKQSRFAFSVKRTVLDLALPV
jgi:hypothetical protein